MVEARLLERSALAGNDARLPGTDARLRAEPNTGIRTSQV